MKETPLKFWTSHKEYCEAELAKAETPFAVQMLQDSIKEAQEAIDAINNGTYEPAQILHVARDIIFEE